jgi:hypothetical protein
MLPGDVAHDGYHMRESHALLLVYVVR